MATRRALRTTGGTPIELLRLTSMSMGVFPPLKNVATGALAIADTKFQTNKQEWNEFKEYVQNAIAAVIESFTQLSDKSQDISTRLEALQRALGDILARVEFELALPRPTRALRLLTDPDIIADLRKKLEDIIIVFQISTTVATQIDARKAFDIAVANSSVFSRDRAAAALNVTLDKLHYVKGASWDIHRTCLSNTRTVIIDQILAWVNTVDHATGPDGADESNPATVMLLTGVAGAGKSTIAHTIAQLCSQNGHLVSSFFFNQEIEGRNSPSALVTTIAADLSRVDPGLAERIAAAIERDQGLPFAPISRQFDELVLEPTRECPVRGPLVIVIDALDEGWDRYMFKILRDDVSRLPCSFRIFVTSRMRPELDSLRRKSHVRLLTLDLETQANMDDIALFIPHRLQQLAEDRDFGSDWPGEQLQSRFEARANGLFLWVDTVCNFLADRDNPTMELEKLLSVTGTGASSAEVQMDRLYATILEACNWEDENFVAGYRQVMGTVLAGKAPLTASAQRALFQNKPVASDFTLQKLSPLLTGTSKTLYYEQPVRLLHQSLRDFLVVRAGNSSGYAKYMIVEQEWNQQLALLCLDLLNRELNGKTAGVGYLAMDTKEVPGIPIISEGEVSEALWYACRFWIDHFLGLKMPVPSTIENALRLFMENKAMKWMEVTTAKGVYRGLGEVQNWMRYFLLHKAVPEAEQLGSKHANACTMLSDRLSYEDRRAESLTAIQEAVGLNLQLATNNPNTFTPDLAASLHRLSKGYHDLGRHEEARVAVQEAIGLRRQLAANDPAAFTLDLAKSLNNLSTCLRSLSRPKESLAAIQEAVSLYPQVPTESLSAAFISQFAGCFHNLSVNLSDAGLHEEALTASEMLVELNRRLVADDPTAFTPNLAMALHKRSIDFYNLHRLEEALVPMHEAINLREQLARDGRTSSVFYLVTSLRCLASFLADMHRYDEALTGENNR